MTSKRIASLSLLAIFILGFVFGVASDRSFFTKMGRYSKHKDHRPNLVEKFTKELNLTNEQQKHLVMLLEKVKKQHSEIKESTRPQYERVREEFKSAFSEILTEEQRMKYLEFDKRCDKKRKR